MVKYRCHVDGIEVLTTSSGSGSELWIRHLLCVRLTPVGYVAEREEDASMPKFVIEREIPGAGKLSSQELHAISKKSCNVLSAMGPQVQWVQSYVTENKVYCVYIAPNEEAVREHARQGGFPANTISRVLSVIDPTTAE
jgi:hypothetical protein